MRPLLCLTFLFLFSGASYAQKNSGVFYSTIFAKTGPYSRLTDFGREAQAWFLRDVNGDGKDDAIAYLPSGQVKVALSSGTAFTSPEAFLTYPGNGAELMMGDVNGDERADLVFFDIQKGGIQVALSSGTGFAPPGQWGEWKQLEGAMMPMLADVNGDGKDDALLIFREGGVAQWYAALSDGKGFKRFSSWITGFGDDADLLLTGDLNGDGKADALRFIRQTGNWEAMVSGRKKMENAAIWKREFGINADTGMVYDIDRDGKDDILHYENGRWQVAYSTGRGFSGDQLWITGHRPATMVSRGNKPVPEAKFPGSISGDLAGACIVSDGEWLYLENNRKDTTVNAVLTDTWTAWGNQYTPSPGGTPGTYDAGDTAVLDQQIRMIHDAGFTYIMLDITNGANAWVDKRAARVIDRIRRWNEQLADGQHKLYYCIAMGGSRGKEGAAAAASCEAESKRTWTEFYQRYPEGYYLLKGKPLLVHFVWDLKDSEGIISRSTSMPYFNKFTIRWMYNDIPDDPRYANAYGWPVLEKGGNPEGSEVMDVTPGFWNGARGVPRQQGEHYRSHWVRVLRFNPQSVWLNSFNETWEHTSVEPAWLPPEAADAFPELLETWTDYKGNRMDDFYWVMTKQYNRLYMYDELFEHSYLQESGKADIFMVGRDGISSHGATRPAGAPVLLVPAGFIKDFEGTVINEQLEKVGTIQKHKDFKP